MTEKSPSHNELPRSVLAIVGVGFVGAALFVLSDLSGLKRDNFLQALVAILFAVGIGAVVLALFPQAKSTTGEIEKVGAKFTVAGGVAVIAGVLTFIYISTTETRPTESQSDATQSSVIATPEQTPVEVSYVWEAFCSVCFVRDSFGNPLYDANGNYLRPTGVGSGPTIELARQSAAQNCQANGGNYNSCFANAYQLSP